MFNSRTYYIVILKRKLLLGLASDTLLCNLVCFCLDAQLWQTWLVQSSVQNEQFQIHYLDSLCMFILLLLGTIYCLSVSASRGSCNVLLCLLNRA